jgi:integrase
MASQATRRKKRGAGEGSPRVRADGRWEIRFTLPSGRSRSVYGKTESEARRAHRAALREIEDGLDLQAGRTTVGQFFRRWLEDVVIPGRAPKTHDFYAKVFGLYIEPEIGKVALDKLSPSDVARLLRAKQDSGLSPRTVHHVRAVLRAGLNQAVKWRMVGFNAAALVESPPQKPGRIVPLTVDEARRVLVAAKDHRLGPLFRVALTLGLRQGELLGLRWVDVDLDRGNLRVARALQRVDGKLVVKAPKTAKSRRTLRLPPSLVEALRGHRETQALERAAAGARWTDSGYVFVSTVGTPLDARNVLRAWHRLLEAADLERRAFHVTRHTAISLLIAEGVPLKVVQEVAGHSQLATTADVYGHLYEDAFADAADAMERALG